MTREDGPQGPAQADLSDRESQLSRPATAVPSTTCQFCGAPASRPNRKVRRQRGADSVPFVMLHAVWCRAFGEGTSMRSKRAER